MAIQGAAASKARAENAHDFEEHFAPVAFVEKMVNQDMKMGESKEVSFDLTVITVCFNEAKKIAETCESIVNQSRQDFEWIVVDGGSTDGTLEILKKYEDRISVLVSEKDNGIYNAMNKGIALARGKYLNFMNGGDCFFDCFAIEKFFELYDPDLPADVFYGDMQRIRGKHVKTFRFPDYITKSYLLENTINHQAAFIRKELFDRYGLYDERYKIISDCERFIVFKENKCSFVHIPYVISKFDGEGVSFTGQKKLIAEHQFSTNAHFSVQEQDLVYGQNNPRVIKFFLFGFIQIYRIENTRERGMHYLFGSIPFLRIKRRF